MCRGSVMPTQFGSVHHVCHSSVFCLFGLSLLQEFDTVARTQADTQSGTRKEAFLA
eukprot:m.8654 g.8654  ORF g.8654 m.8654 type:complete len:56 (-) comp5382_c0_seq1:2504-2671(-)